ncbi:carbon-nitrogen hydrolase family protein [Ornithinimicrobium cavernae]|uniref:carbon-nitrogen hydrolase family protein n=1 Tax=Ornithinimicrobium cavernae TaxID=2666047 RepID=UPI00192A24FC|nr:carbon-nitrogen hydrolase family protein [Ornithinimicrobium cavernae]
MSTLNVRASQFAASIDWQENLATIGPIIDQAEVDGVDLLVLPEGVMARFIDQKERIRELAQPLDGPFVTGAAALTEGKQVTVVVGIHERSATERPFNTLVVLRGGRVIEVYRKLHLYDAFNALESDNVTAAEDIPPLVEVNGFQVGLMTCYDVRFPELARILTLNGADVLVLPAAWVKGPLKEHHWRTLVTARALDNTAYLVASGECGEANIGQSLIVDPLGVALAQGTEAPGSITATLTRDRLDDARRRLPVLQNYRFNVEATPRALTVVPAS